MAVEEARKIRNGWLDSSSSAKPSGWPGTYLKFELWQRSEFGPGKGLRRIGQSSQLLPGFLFFISKCGIPASIFIQSIRGSAASFAVLARLTRRAGSVGQYRWLTARGGESAERLSDSALRLHDHARKLDPNLGSRKPVVLGSNNQWPSGPSKLQRGYKEVSLCLRETAWSRSRMSFRVVLSHPASSPH